MTERVLPTVAAEEAFITKEQAVYLRGSGSPQSGYHTPDAGLSLLEGEMSIGLADDENTLAATTGSHSGTTGRLR